MTGNSGGLMELLVQQISKGQYCKNKVPVRKVYIDEDPSKEDTMDCPSCLHRNRKHLVRYLYINLNEAIYKCEAADCMYPFRNFKFKNYEENTVYQYQQYPAPTVLPYQNSLEHDLDSSFDGSYLKSIQSYDHIESLDFNLDFLSCDPGSLPTEVGKGTEAPALLAQSADCDNQPSNTFDTKLIDDLLQDIFSSYNDATPNLLSAPEPWDALVHPSSKEPEGSPQCADDFMPSPVHSPSRGGRKLEKCLKVFQNTTQNTDEGVFKKPMAPKSAQLVVVPITPTKLRIKKVVASSTPRSDHAKGGKHSKRKSNKKPRSSSTSGIRQASALVKSNAIKPLEFVCTLNTLSEQMSKSKQSTETTVEREKKCTNRAKFQKMLNFIQRSMNSPSKDVKDRECVASPPNSKEPNDEGPKVTDGTCQDVPEIVPESGTLSLPTLSWM